jgi:hypothetical protein
LLNSIHRFAIFIHFTAIRQEPIIFSKKTGQCDQSEFEQKIRARDYPPAGWQAFLIGDGEMEWVGCKRLG